MNRMLYAALGAVLLLGVLAGPASAASADANPSARCGEQDIYEREIVWRGQVIHRELPMATHGACASSWATGQMSVAGVVGQCKSLEEGVLLNGKPFVLTYPHKFYGLWWAENRAGCVRILHGLATGKLDADVLPFPV